MAYPIHTLTLNPTVDLACEAEHVRPLVSAASPVRVRCDADVLWRIIAGLRSEWEGGRDQRLIHHWIELAHGEARRIAQPWHVDDRLWAVWEEVARELGWLLAVEWPERLSWPPRGAWRLRIEPAGDGRHLWLQPPPSLRPDPAAGEPAAGAGG